jgi:hypothetical protein
MMSTVLIVNYVLIHALLEYTKKKIYKHALMNCEKMKL